MIEAKQTQKVTYLQASNPDSLEAQIAGWLNDRPDRRIISISVIKTIGLLNAFIIYEKAE